MGSFLSFTIRLRFGVPPSSTYPFHYLLLLALLLLALLLLGLLRLWVCIDKKNARRGGLAQGGLGRCVSLLPLASESAASMRARSRRSAPTIQLGGDVVRRRGRDEDGGQEQPQSRPRHKQTN